MTKRIALALSTIALGTLALTGCTLPKPPCERLPAPTPEQVRVAAPELIEVEHEVGSVDCELITSPDGRTGTWQQESES